MTFDELLAMLRAATAVYEHVFFDWLYVSDGNDWYWHTTANVDTAARGGSASASGDSIEEATYLLWLEVISGQIDWWYRE